MPMFQMCVGSSGFVDDRADEHRHADGVDRLLDQAAGRRRRRSGSMSVEFSGQITRSGCGDPAGCDVRSEPLGLGHVVLQHRLALAEEVHARGRGRCPGPRRRSPSTAPSRSCALGRQRHEPAGGADDARRRRAPRPSRAAGAAPIQANASSAPTRAIANVTAGAPARAAYGVSVVAVWPKARRPHGKPPSGTRSRIASESTHISGTASGQTPQARGGGDPCADETDEQRERRRPRSSHASSPITRIQVRCRQQEGERRRGSRARTRDARGRRASDSVSSARAGGASQTRS